MNLTVNHAEQGIGVRILDCDHREMCETLNELRAALIKEEDRSQTFALLRKTANFTLLHFALEEGMMAATNYPGLALHRIHHQHLAARIKAMVSHFDRSITATQEQSLRFLTESHAAHVENDDLYYGFWLNASILR